MSAPEVYKDERLPLYVSLFLPSYYIRNNETQYPARNGRKRIAEMSERKGERERGMGKKGVSSVDPRWTEKPSTTMELLFYQSAPVTTLLNAPPPLPPPEINNKFPL